MFNKSKIAAFNSNFLDNLFNFLIVLHWIICQNTNFIQDITKANGKFSSHQQRHRKPIEGWKLIFVPIYSDISRWLIKLKMSVVADLLKCCILESVDISFANSGDIPISCFSNDFKRSLDQIFNNVLHYFDWTMKIGIGRNKYWFLPIRRIFAKPWTAPNQKYFENFETR